MKTFKRSFILLLSFITLWNNAQNLPQKPNTLVSDNLGFFTAQEKAQLESKLVEFNNTTGTQIAITTMKSLDGNDIDDLSQRILEYWGVGRKGKDNGILVLIKPKTEYEKGEISISIGYGLEAVIPDATAKRIIEVEVTPHFKNGNHYAGIEAATNKLMALAAKEFTAEEYLATTKQGSGDSITGLIIFGFFLVFIISGFLRRRRTYSSVGRNLPFWMMMGMMGSSRGHSSGFGGFSSGSGSFGGFGGGLGGGGGASGSW